MQFGSFDASIVDWVLSNGMAEAPVARLRSRSATGAIGLLTDKAGSSEIDERELVTAIELDWPVFLH